MNVGRSHFVLYVSLISTACLGAPTLPSPVTSPAAGAPAAVNAAGNKAAELSIRFGPVLDRLEKRVAQADGGDPDTRDLANGALTSMLLGRDAQETKDLLNRLFASQDMDSSSDSYGSFPWQIGHPEIHDQNADEFASQALGPLWTAYGQALGQPFLDTNLPHIRAAIAALKRRQFRQPSYTNIFLMRATNLILIGEAIGDQDSARYGYQEIERFRVYTHANGIHEFDSNTYYATDLNSLYMGARFAQNREPFLDILTLFWQDIDANYFPGSGYLSGPHSRDYDFLTSAGGIDYYLWASGLKPSLEGTGADLEKCYVLLALLPGGVLTPQTLLPVYRVPRMVVSRWGPDIGQDRTNFIDRHFAIGCANADYGPQDKLISVELDGGYSDITVVPDTTDKPYGKLKTKDSSGHDKPTHLPLNPACVQDRGLVLATLDLDPHKAGPITSLATNILLPAAAGIAVDGSPVDVSAPFEQALTTSSVVTVGQTNALVAIRVVRADGVAGFTPQIVLEADRESLKYGIVRLAIYAYLGDVETLSEDHARVGLILRAQDLNAGRGAAAAAADLRDARITQSDASGMWTVDANVAGNDVALSRDGATRAVRSRSIDGREWTAPAIPLVVDDSSPPRPSPTPP